MKVVTIGRNPQNDVVINDPYVGRNHLQIIQKNDGSFLIVDLGSKNGTYVNGVQVVGQMPLSPVDVVRVGNTTLPWKNYFQGGSSSPRGVIKSVRIGRIPEGNDEVINDSRVSRIHCRIDEYANGKFKIVDLGSKNGTFVNGRMIQGETWLSSSDVVQIGNTTLSWRRYFSTTVSTGNGSNSTDIDIDYGGKTGKESVGTYSLVVFFLGLIALGIDVYIVIKYFTSFANQLALAFGGVESSIKLFPIYLRGYFGINGQWGFVIAALVLGIIADFVEGVLIEKDTEKDKLASVGLAMANVAITVSIIFLLLAAFATKIVTNLY